MTKTFCDCCGKDIHDPERECFENEIISLGVLKSEVTVDIRLRDCGFDICDRCVYANLIAALQKKIDVENTANQVKITPPPQLDLKPFMNAVDKEIRKMTDSVYATHCTLDNNLTREQFQEALIQSVNSGDFMKFVRIENAIVFGGKQQCVTYEPFRRVRELEANKEELNGFLDTAINLLSQVKECTIDCDFSSVSIENLCKNIELFKKRVER
jgi:hypothetical protein